MSLSSLQVLADNRDSLLLAEIAAWLHDMGKCADEHIENQASDKPANTSYKYKTAQSHRLPETVPSIVLRDEMLRGETVTVKDLIEKGMPRIISDTSQPWILRVLGKCHAIAHVEKELDDNDAATKQRKDNMRLSSAFGVESDDPVKDLTSKLNALPFTGIQCRSLFVPSVEETFNNAPGDTRRPVNEVTLADWSGAVASLYKSALAGMLLGVKPDPDDLRWRLLRVNFDVLGLYAKAIKIADLLAYQNAVNTACQKVKTLVEEEYPLGNEIYRDTTGIYFTFPDLDLPNDLAQEIRCRVDGVEPELAPRIAVTVGDGSMAREQLKGILGKARREALQSLSQPFSAENLSYRWQEKWENTPSTDSKKKWEVCPVCRLRPKEESAQVCEHCQERRGSRLESWKQNPSQTIWLGEIADHNDRVALLVGKFGLDDWLSGDLVQTMLVKAFENNPGACVPKNPSPARLRRVWETCQQFWTETVEGILKNHKYAKGDLRCARLLVIPDKKNDWRENVPYDGTVNGKPISLLWREKDKHFVTISNLQLAAGDAKDVNEFAYKLMRQQIVISDPDNPRQQIPIVVQCVMQAKNRMGTYSPYLPLLASPDQFLALVPAAEALNIVEKIKTEYEKQMGKVRNRLPLFLGVIYFERKMPLMAVMDAARQMLNAPFNEEEWIVNQYATDGKVQFKNGITWNVQTKMGDGSTPDEWYPYYFVKQAASVNHPRRFQLRKEGDNETQKVGAVGDKYANRWLVHVNDVKSGDTVHITPSRFDFLWLDSASRRFEIAYDQNGRRPPHLTRPFYLEDLDRLEQIWQTFSKLTKTQMKHILQTIEMTRERWNLPFDTLDQVFEQFVTDTLVNAQWEWKKALSPAEQQRLITAAARGELSDLAELHFEILKEKKE